jgi:hypothetical protein
VSPSSPLSTLQMSVFASAAVLLPLLSALVPSVHAQDPSPTATGVISTGTNGSFSNFQLEQLL